MNELAKVIEQTCTNSLDTEAELASHLEAVVARIQTSINEVVENQSKLEMAMVL